MFVSQNLEQVIARVISLVFYFWLQLHLEQHICAQFKDIIIKWYLLIENLWYYFDDTVLKYFLCHMTMWHIGITFVCGGVGGGIWSHFNLWWQSYAPDKKWSIKSKGKNSWCCLSNTTCCRESEGKTNNFCHLNLGETHAILSDTCYPTHSTCLLFGGKSSNDQNLYTGNQAVLAEG